MEHSLVRESGQDGREPSPGAPRAHGRGRGRTDTLPQSPVSPEFRTARPAAPRRGSESGTGPVLGRALQILGAFSADCPEMTLSELSRRSGLPVSTVHRMLGELMTWGALERGRDGCYRVGLRLWEVGSLAPRGQGLRERALPFLEDLSRITRENVQLAVREGAELVFVERIAGTGAVPVLTRVGGRFALTATGVGLVLLAHAPAEVQDQVLAGPFERFTPCTVTDPRELRRMLAEARTNGCVVSDRQVTLDALSVAAPVHGSDGAVIAAVSLVVRHGSTSPHALARLVCTSARAISRAMVAPAA
ncbi:IclR family transcriptional regulator [Streptomyces enissocaesilis]|uniref:IclR family transcriptional regulator n=1 Tax=Streptomyces enissocaesilis TaxID=332589 RepID=A0ABP6JN68_9ACTN